MEIFFTSVKDFLSRRIIFLNLAPFAFSIIALGTLTFFGISEVFGLLSDGASSGDFSFIDEAAHPTLAWFLGFAIVHWLVVALFTYLGTLGVIYASLIFSLVVVGFLTPIVVNYVRDTHYPHVQKTKEWSVGFTCRHFFKVFIKFLLLFACSLPLLIVPIVNLFVIQLPFFYLFYQFFVADLASSGICEGVQHIIASKRFLFLFVLAIFFMLSMIPLVGLLLQLFFVVFLSHMILSNKKI